MVSNEFGGNYLLLEAEEATLLDLGTLLFSSNLEHRRFIDCPRGLEAREFRERWLVFISVLAQKLFVALRIPLRKFGDMLESFLNLVSSNGGIFRLLLNILRGKVITMERSSPEFMSVAGFADKRMGLEKYIQQDDPKYKAMLSMMASKLAYENENFIGNAVTNLWGMEFLGLYNFWNDYQERYSTQATIVQDTKSEPNLIVVAFRGTVPFNSDQWRTDVDLSWYEIPNVGRVHSGFMKALGLQKDAGWPKEIGPKQHCYAYYKLREELKAMLQTNKDAKFIVTGHSLGGALAILFAAVLILHDEAWLLEKLDGVYTFGQPRVGDTQFGEFMKKKLQEFEANYERYVYSNDVVPRIPYDDETRFFRHFGPCLYFNSLYEGQVLEEEPNKNYFSLWWVIPKVLTALWELVRSFLMPLVFGSDYREPWLMTGARVQGLMIPGLPAHLPTDYINATRLGSLNSLLHLPASHDSKTD